PRQVRHRGEGTGGRTAQPHEEDRLRQRGPVQRVTFQGKRSNTMKFPAGSFTALIVGAALAVLTALAPATATGAEEKAPKNSAALAKPLKEANDDIKAKKFSDAITKLKAAEGMSGKT